MGLFKRKKQDETQEDYEYWKDPRLDDEGTYDYLLCGKPDNKQYKCWSDCKCDHCGKEPRFKRYGEAWEVYWYCYDGWDGDSGFVCWKCLLKQKIHGWLNKIKKKREKKKKFRELCKGFKMSKEQKQELYEIVMSN